MDLESLRRKIDAIDREILARLNARARLAAKVGREKRRLGADVYVPEREKQIFRRLTERKNPQLPADAVRAIYREIISASTALQKKLRIVSVDSEGACARAAALLNFGASAHYRSFANAADAAAALASGSADYAVLPADGEASQRKRQDQQFKDAGLKIVAVIKPSRNLGLGARYHVLARR